MLASVNNPPTCFYLLDWSWPLPLSNLHLYIVHILYLDLPCHVQCVCFSLIRLEFNQQHLNYYTELDAVILYGKPAHRTSVEQKNAVGFSDLDASLTARLFSQLSLTEGQEDLQHNGFFDILPVCTLVGWGGAGRGEHLMGWLCCWFASCCESFFTMYSSSPLSLKTRTFLNSANNKKFEVSYTWFTVQLFAFQQFCGNICLFLCNTEWINTLHLLILGINRPNPSCTNL